METRIMISDLHMPDVQDMNTATSTSLPGNSTPDWAYNQQTFYTDTPTISLSLEEEEDENVERELILALGRIGSPAAVQALIKFAQPGGRLFGRRPAGLRTIAIEALRLAATPAAVGTLEGLTDDGDRQVRAAAQSALADLKRK